LKTLEPMHIFHNEYLKSSLIRNFNSGVNQLQFIVMINYYHAVWMSSTYTKPVMKNKREYYIDYFFIYLTI
jgi:hypothetical protein